VIKDDQSRVGGHIGIERIVELGSVLGRNAIPALVSRMQQKPVAAMNALHRTLTESFYYHCSGMASKHFLSLVCSTTRCVTCSPTKNKKTGRPGGEDENVHEVF
jgi:hypothetical protein